MTTKFIVLALIVGTAFGYLFASITTAPPSESHSMSMEDMMSAMNAELEGKQGDEFDQVFLSEMIVHHQGAVAMAELARQNAGHAEIKQLAEGIITAQEAEIAQMQSWQAAWYGSADAPAHH